MGMAFQRTAQVTRVLDPNRQVCPRIGCQGELMPCGQHSGVVMVTLTKYKGDINCWLCQKCGRHWYLKLCDEANPAMYPKVQ